MKSGTGNKIEKERYIRGILFSNRVLYYIVERLYLYWGGQDGNSLSVLWKQRYLISIPPWSDFNVGELGL